MLTAEVYPVARVNNEDFRLAGISNLRGVNVGYLEILSPIIGDYVNFGFGSRALEAED